MTAITAIGVKSIAPREKKGNQVRNRIKTGDVDFLRNLTIGFHGSAFTHVMTADAITIHKYACNSKSIISAVAFNKFEKTINEKVSLNDSSPLEPQKKRSLLSLVPQKLSALAPLFRLSMQQQRLNLEAVFSNFQQA